MHEYNRGMWSDSRMSSRPLRKRVCTRCGLVRDGNAFNADELTVHYADAYQLNTADETCEHHFFKDGRALARSEAIARWMFDALAPSDHDRTVSSIYEVGAGQGRLLRRFAAEYPRARVAGCEPNRRAAAVASRDWFQVAAGDERTMCGVHDLIVASFVLEHVPSPTGFLRRLAEHLSASGRLVVAQPMQDVESHDIYFVDHLHHFAVRHVDWAANRAGLVPLATVTAPWFAPNASVHVLARGDADPVLSYAAPAAIERPSALQNTPDGPDRGYARNAALLQRAVDRPGPELAQVAHVTQFAPEVEDEIFQLRCGARDPVRSVGAVAPVHPIDPLPASTLHPPLHGQQTDTKPPSDSPQRDSRAHRGHHLATPSLPNRFFFFSMANSLIEAFSPNIVATASPRLTCVRWHF